MAKQKKIAPEQKQKISDEAYEKGLEKTADKYKVHFSTIHYWRKQGQVVYTKQKKQSKGGFILEGKVPIAGVFARSPEIIFKDDYDKILSLKLWEAGRFNTMEKGKIVNACRYAIKSRYPDRNYLVKKVSETDSRIWRIEAGKKTKRSTKNNTAI